MRGMRGMRGMSTTYNSYLNVCGKMCAWFHEHTCRYCEVCDCYISSGFLNGREMNVNALNISSGRGIEKP